MQSFIDNLDETAMKAAADYAKQDTQKFTETTEFKEPLAYVETMLSKDVSQYQPMRMVWMPWWK